MHPLVNIAVKAARSGSKIILRALDRLDTITVTEKHHNDFVTEIDQQVEQEIINTIHSSYPNHAIWAEESGRSGACEYTWLIDPIDGTTNFLHGHPHFCIAIGIQHKNIVEHGVIYDPIRQELFTATRGTGAFLNDRRIRVAQRHQLAGALIGTGFNPSALKNIDLYLKTLAALLPHSAGIRRSGSAALDLAYVAAGRIDGFWEMALAPWDLAAGALIAKEAGGIVVDFQGRNNYLTTGNIVAANASIVTLLTHIIKSKQPK